MKKVFPILFLVLFSSSFGVLSAPLKYQITITNIFPAKMKGFIATFKDLNPPPRYHELLVVPFSKTRFCRALVEETKQNYVLAQNINCPHHLLKKGQRILIKRPHGKIVTNHNSKPKKKNIIQEGNLYVDEVNRNVSYTFASIPSSTKTSIGACYEANSVMGDYCEMKVVEINGTVATLDSSTCSFERDLDEGQILRPCGKN